MGQDNLLIFACFLMWQNTNAQILPPLQDWVSFIFFSIGTEHLLSARNWFRFWSFHKELLPYIMNITVLCSKQVDYSTSFHIKLPLFSENHWETLNNGHLNITSLLLFYSFLWRIEVSLLSFMQRRILHTMLYWQTSELKTNIPFNISNERSWIGL